MEETDKILEELKQINQSITKEDMKNATKEEIEQYLKLADEITARLQILKEE